MFVLDGQDRVVDLNLAGQHLVGASAQEAIGQPISQVLRKWPAAVDAVRDQTPMHVETALNIKNELRHFDVHLSPLTDARGNLTGRVVVARDITERKRAEESLRQASLALAQTQAQMVEQQHAMAIWEERERLARELHDNLGQVLGFVNLQAQATRKFLADGNLPQSDARLERLVTVAQNAQAQLRDTIAQLKSPTQSERHLFPALASQIENLERDYDLRVTLEIAPTVAQRGFEPAVSAQLLGIIQEALANVGKHAGAANVRVALIDEGDLAEITIADDGQGWGWAAPERET